MPHTVNNSSPNEMLKNSLPLKPNLTGILRYQGRNEGFAIRESQISFLIPRTKNSENFHFSQMVFSEI